MPKNGKPGDPVDIQVEKRNLERTPRKGEPPSESNVIRGGQAKKQEP